MKTIGITDTGQRHSIATLKSAAKKTAIATGHLEHAPTDTTSIVR